MTDMVPVPNTKILKNGAIYDLDKGRIVDGSGITTKITGENAIAYIRKRQEKTAMLIRSGLMRASGSQSSMEAIALGAEKMYRGVLDDMEDLEKRRKAWLSIGKQAGLLTDYTPAGENSTGNAGMSDENMGKALDLLSRLVELAKSG